MQIFHTIGTATSNHRSRVNSGSTGRQFRMTSDRLGQKAGVGLPTANCLVCKRAVEEQISGLFGTFGISKRQLLHIVLLCSHTELAH